MSIPASAMTFDSLIQDIVVYCERTDEPFISQVPRFIMLAENRIASENKPLGLLRVVSGNLEGNTFKKPIRWRKTKSLSITVDGRKVFLYERGYEYCKMYAPDGSVPGTPRFYADYDYEHWFIAPTPDKQYPLEAQYWERPEPLSSDNQTNWLTRYAPQVLLYAALMEAMPFLKTSERIQEFQGLYDRAMQSIVKEDQERYIDASNVR